MDAESIVTGEGGQDRGHDAGKRTRGRMRHLVTDTLGLLLVFIGQFSLGAVPSRGQGDPGVSSVRFAVIALIGADAGHAHQIDEGLVTWARTAIRVVLKIVRRINDVKGEQVLPRRWVESGRSAA